MARSSADFGKDGIELYEKLFALVEHHFDEIARERSVTGEDGIPVLMATANVMLEVALAMYMNDRPRALHLVSEAVNGTINTAQKTVQSRLDEYFRDE